MIRFASILAASAAFGFAAQAAEAVTFETLDTNDDGLITESEFVSWKTADGETSSAEAIIKFLSADADGSGGITQEEFDVAMGTTAPKDQGMNESDTLPETY